MKEFPISQIPVHRLDSSSADAQTDLLAFDGRDAYVDWVSGWKAAMASTVVAIRSAKRSCRDGSLGDARRSAAQARRAVLRTHAHNLIALRHAAKRKAGRQRSMRAA